MGQRGVLVVRILPRDLWDAFFRVFANARFFLLFIRDKQRGCAALAQTYKLGINPL